MPAKPFAVPSDHGIGLHDNQRRTPVVPTLGEEDPEQSVGRAEQQTFHGLRQRGQLLTENEVLAHDGPVLASGQSDPLTDHHQRRQHA